MNLQGFNDLDWVGSPSDKKITSRAIFNVGSTTVSWYSRKKIFVALNSIKDEYMVASQ